MTDSEIVDALAQLRAALDAPPDYDTMLTWDLYPWQRRLLEQEQRRHERLNRGAL